MIEIRINGIAYKLKQSFRGLMLFEEMTGTSVSVMEESTGNMIKMLYCLLKANNRELFKWSFDEFIDVLDDNPEILTTFSNYLVSLQGKAKEEVKKKTAKNR